jgi:cytochrome c oxidase assembly protein subunit 11
VSTLAAQDRNRRTALITAGVALAFLALAFASVPLYRLFCQATGYAGTPRKELGATAPGAIAGTMSIRFDGNVNGIPWTFGPERETQRVSIGARSIAFFDATNGSDKPITGRAVFNVSPDEAAKYFVKIQCFCFTLQTLAPHQSVRMPVMFYVDPAIEKDPEVRDISEITLSYTFYEVDHAPAQG